MTAKITYKQSRTKDHYSKTVRTGRDRREVPPVSVETGTHFDERRRYRRVFVGENKMAAR